MNTDNKDNLGITKKLRGRSNNQQGKIFERYIEAGCKLYQNEEVAVICKVPEGFRVLKKFGGGRFSGQFIGKAQPDYSGTLNGGRSIVFEAKHTTKDRIKKDVLTVMQENVLNEHYVMGGFSGVVVGIKERAFFVPWEIWRDMKKKYGRQYLTVNDLEEYEIVYDGVLRFLELKNGKFSFEQEGLEWLLILRS